MSLYYSPSSFHHFMTKYKSNSGFTWPGSISSHFCSISALAGSSLPCCSAFCWKSSMISTYAAEISSSLALPVALEEYARTFFLYNVEIYFIRGYGERLSSC